MGNGDSKPRESGRHAAVWGIGGRPAPSGFKSHEGEKNDVGTMGMEFVPLYVDSRSVIYSDTFLPDQANEKMSEAECMMEDFDIGTPSVPLSSSCFVSLDKALPTSGFLTTPQYNAEGNETAEEMMFHSPVLRSYHDTSFLGVSSSFSRVSPPNSQAGSLSASSITGTTAAGTRPSTFRHNRFLEIAGDPSGLENYGNTCYANSVVQLIYHCAPLRLRLLELFEGYKARRGYPGFEENTVLYAFCQLISTMHKANNIRKKEDTRKSIPPRAFLQRVGEKNPFFKNEQQDAHEFCMFLLNEIMEAEKKIMENPKNARFFQEEQLKSSKGLFSSKSKSTPKKPLTGDGNVTLPLQAIMQGKFVSITACLNCETITCKRETFLDLSLETRQGCSLLDCLSHYGDPSLFHGSNKLKCDNCKRAVNAANTMHVEELPQFALLIHLKRFCYDPEKKDFAKTAYHVALPMDMDVEEYRVEEQVGSTAPPPPPPPPPEAEKETEEEDFNGIQPHVRRKLRGVAHRKARFELTGFVAHVGKGPNVGHYFTCTRYGPNIWRRFDDDTVSTMTKREVQQLFGVPIDASGMVTTTAYILLYERVA